MNPKIEWELVEVGEDSPKFRLFDGCLYQLHTNFLITSKKFAVIENVKGVESISALTPYRLMIGVGKVFDPQDVFHRISVVLGIAPSPKVGRHFAIVSLPDGECRLIRGDSPEEVEFRMEGAKGLHLSWK